MRRAAWLLAIVGLAAACSGQPAVAPTSDAAVVTPAELEPSEPFDVATVTLVDPDGATLPIEVFDDHTPEMRRRGLMERAELPATAGMVFRYPADSEGGFWMKNTLIPLSIAYYDADGVIHTVLDMEPCTEDPCPSYPPGASYRGALEVNQGFFAEIGLEPGWRVDLPSGLPPAQA
jgi:uncharacterized protein